MRRLSAILAYFTSSARSVSRRILNSSTSSFISPYRNTRVDLSEAFLLQLKKTCSCVTNVHWAKLGNQKKLKPQLQQPRPQDYSKVTSVANGDNGGETIKEVNVSQKSWKWIVKAVFFPWLSCLQALFLNRYGREHTGPSSYINQSKIESILQRLSKTVWSTPEGCKLSNSSMNPPKRITVQFPRFGLCDPSLLACVLFHCPTRRIKTARLTELSCMKVRLFFLSAFHSLRAPTSSNFPAPCHTTWLCCAITFDVPRSSRSVGLHTASSWLWMCCTSSSDMTRATISYAAARLKAMQEYCRSAVFSI